MMYRAEIDGLRAVAVIAVILNHLPGEYFASGFLGVDVFFVISGFVVTASLSGTQMTQFGSFYSRFLARRIKRLWPALLVCVGITSLIVLAVEPYPNTTINTGIASLFGLANMALFHIQLDYFSASSKLNAFTHTWSLGVEEQFYVVFPLIVWFFFRGSEGAHKKLNYALITIALVSVVLFVFYYSHNQPAAYFLMPMRMWELCAGALAFLISTRVQDIPLLNALSRRPVYIVIALLGCFLLPQEHAALSTIMAVLLTALLLLSQVESVPKKILSSSPVVYVGKISYSLYLYHWPVVVMAPVILPDQLRSSAVYVAIMLGAAALSYHLVESPVRKGLWTLGNSRIIAAGLGSSCVVALAIYVAFANVDSIRLEEYSRAYPPRNFPLPHSGLKHNPTCVVDARNRPFALKKFEKCTIPPASNSGMPTIWYEGDSHAGHLQGLMVSLYETRGLGFHLIETPGKFFPAVGKKESFPPRLEIHELILDNAKPGDAVAIARRFIDRTSERAAMKGIGTWVRRVSRLAETLEKRDLKLIIFGPIPVFNFEDLRMCNAQLPNSCSIEREGVATQVDLVLDKLAVLTREHKNVYIFDPFSVLCPPVSGRCYSHSEGSFLYREKEHLNSYGATQLAGPYFEWLQESGLVKGSG